MGEAVTFALVAGFFTATSSVCQRLGTRHAETGGRFSVRLILDLLGQPLWLAGVGSMILGFVFQLVALDFGSLALVQPILATELLFVFGYMAILGSRRVVRRDWIACSAMALGLGVFLFVANPSGGKVHTSGESWWLAGLAAGGTTVILTAGVYLPRRKRLPLSPARRAATLGVAAGVAWGFVAAVIKELSSHISHGAGAVFAKLVTLCVDRCRGRVDARGRARSRIWTPRRIPTRVHHRRPARRQPPRRVHLQGTPAPGAGPSGRGAGRAGLDRGRGGRPEPQPADPPRVGARRLPARFARRRPGAT